MTLLTLALLTGLSSLAMRATAVGSATLLAMSGDLPSEAAETVVVTGAGRGAAVFEAPYTVNVVSRDKLTRKLVRNLPEALSETPGVMVQKTSAGQGGHSCAAIPGIAR